MPIISFNPATEEVNQEFPELKPKEVQKKLETAERAFGRWRTEKISTRVALFEKFGELLKSEKDQHGETITKEMGKLLGTAVSEVEKCASVVDYYKTNAEKILETEMVDNGFSKSYIKYEPLGVLLAVMPWNYPFSQVLRFAIPAMIAGNVIVLKHSSQVPLSALALEKLFLDAGFPEGVFQTLLIGSKQVPAVIENRIVKGVSLTGSGPAGGEVAAVAGRAIKPSVLELGGSDAFIVLDDVNLEEVVKQAADARLKNNGQACNAAKRFIVSAKIYDDFLEGFRKIFAGVKMGDPMDAGMQLGPLASQAAQEGTLEQVELARKHGATAFLGGNATKVNGKGFYFEPTILIDVAPKNPIWNDEFFAPVAMIFSAKNESEMLEIANSTDFGLCGSVWSSDADRAEALAQKVEAGMVTINQPASSHPTLPFGGIKKSGFGREYGEYGLKTFTNVKSFIVK